MSTATIAAPGRDAPPEADPLQLVVFGLGADDYAVPITMVQEIIRHSAPRSMPGSGPGVEGLINLRGAIMPVVDLRRHLPAAGGRPGESRIVIVDLAGGTAGLHVDEVREVLTVPGDAVEEPPATLGSPHDDTLSAIVKLEGRLLVILDPAALLRASGIG